MEALPALRYVDAVPIEHEGQRFVCFSDPTGYVEEQLMLSPPAYFVAIHLDGKRDIEAVREAFAGQFNGAQVPAEQVEDIVSYLDEHGFLLTPRFDAVKAKVEGDYRALSARPARLAGQGYPAGEHALHEFLDELFTRDGAPGTPPRSMPVANGAAPLRCLVSPHIDFGRGGIGYAHAYQRLLDAGRPRTVFIFGVAHAAVPAPFILSRKDFETPFGTVPCDKDIVDELAAVCDGDPFEHEFTHRGEHSIEFQTVMLAYLYGSSVKIVPILCSMVCEDPEQIRPADVPAVQRFLDKCNEIAARPELRATVIAGADLAHVGKRFGDAFDIDDAIVEGVAARDREDLVHVMACAPDAWHDAVMRDANARRVCGLGCIYAALKSVEGRDGEADLLHYGYAHDPAGGIVSFAGVALT